MHSNFSRRRLLRSTATGAAAFFGLRASLGNRAYAAEAVGFGPLIPDPEGLLDLPRGFKYRAFSVTGELMDDGYRVPGAHDGMAAFLMPTHTPYASTNKSLVYDTGTSAPRGRVNQITRSNISSGSSY